MLAVVKYLAIFGTIALTLPSSGSAEKGWWKTASFYQIYPRSFKDSNGDGIGDLNGVTEQLAYLKEIGITATWLSPIFTSPMADFGYDISNFTEIDPMFGTLEDFKALLTRAKALGIKIILDFVPNHSSDECDWFQRSVAGDPEYRDFYTWHSGKVVNGIRRPPSNWLSVFGGPAWTWNEKRQAYYLHQFHHKQPDLNFRNPAVVNAMKDVMRYWLRLGVAGFRVDAVPHMFEVAMDANGNLPDEPKDPNAPIQNPEVYEYLSHIYTTNLPEAVEMIYQFREVLEEIDAELQSTDDSIMMTEAYSDIATIMMYFGDGIRNGSQIPFNFELIANLNDKSSAYDFAERINNWMSHMPEGRTANWVLGNHDQTRIGSRFGIDLIDPINILLSTLPGASVTYQGEEIGMTNVPISWEDTIDPQACQGPPEIFEQKTRDPVRTPFQWSNERNAGFSTGNSTWLPINENYQQVNVKRQRSISLSHLNVYKQLRALRELRTFREGNIEVKPLSPNVLTFKRSLAGEKSYITVLNISDDVETVNLHAAFAELSTHLQYIVVSDKSSRRKNDITFADSVLLMPKEGIVLATL